MRRIGARTSRAELAAIVCAALEATGDEPVLVGGATVTIYSDGRYRSDDLDIVTYRDRAALRPLMRELGFEEGPMYWSHPATPLFVQFVSPPPMVGLKYISKTERHRLPTPAGSLPILSPLDAACDRMAHYLNGDQQSMEQCVEVVLARRVRVEAIRRWLAKEPWPDAAKREALVRLRRLVSVRRGAARR